MGVVWTTSVVILVVVIASVDEVDNPRSPTSTRVSLSPAGVEYPGCAGDGRGRSRVCFQSRGVDPQGVPISEPESDPFDTRRH